MASEFARTNEEDLPHVADFLRETFGSTADAPYLDAALMRWKYYEPFPGGDSSRSTVLRDGQKILAHAALWPQRVRTADGVVDGLTYYDWAASKEHPGIGLLLVKRLVRLAPFMTVVGGAEITRQIMPRVGFAHRADLPVYARVLRPLRQLTTRPTRLGWREPARTARNVGWSLAPLAPARGWVAQSVDLPDAALLASEETGYGTVHTPEFLRYVQRCPSVRFRYFHLLNDGALRGYFTLSQSYGQSRVADLRLLAPAHEDWAAALAAVVATARQDRTISELVGLASTPALDAAFAANGFRVRDRRPLFVHDPQSRLAGLETLHLGMLDDDSAFSQMPHYPYLT